MNKRISIAVTGAVVLALVMGATLATALADRTVQFGRLSTGSGCLPPTCFDDKSFHSLDRIIPGSVNIKTGETVGFNVEGFHQVAIYEPGVKPKDIDPQNTPLVAGPPPWAFPFSSTTTLTGLCSRRQLGTSSTRSASPASTSSSAT